MRQGRLRNASGIALWFTARQSGGRSGDPGAVRKPTCELESHSLRCVTETTLTHPTKLFQPSQELCF
jgi:hypothetical protein